MEGKSTIGWLELIKGIVFLALGIIALFLPELAFSATIVFFGIIAILFGLSDVTLYRKFHNSNTSSSVPRSSEITPLLSGIASIVGGVLLVLNPLIGQWIIGLIIPLWFIAHCASRIISYNTIKKLTNSSAVGIMLWLNIIGLLIGIIMVFNPLLFTISIGVLVAISFLLIGFGCIVEAFCALRSSPNRISVLR